MEKFVIPHGGKDGDSINRTIRWQGELYQRLMDIVDSHNTSFNRLVNEAVRYALDSLDQKESEEE